MKHAATVNRLKRIEGQIRGVARMVEEDRYCIDILHQIQAVKAALGKAENEILKGHAAPLCGRRHPQQEREAAARKILRTCRAVREGQTIASEFRPTLDYKNAKLRACRFWQSE